MQECVFTPGRALRPARKRWTRNPPPGSYLSHSLPPQQLTAVFRFDPPHRPNVRNKGFRKIPPRFRKIPTRFPSWRPLMSNKKAGKWSVARAGGLAGGGASTAVPLTRIGLGTAARRRARHMPGVRVSSSHLTCTSQPSAAKNARSTTWAFVRWLDPERVPDRKFAGARLGRRRLPVDPLVKLVEGGNQRHNGPTFSGWAGNGRILEPQGPRRPPGVESKGGAVV